MDGLTFESIGLTGWIAWWVALWVTPPPLCEVVFIYCKINYRVLFGYCLFGFYSLDYVGRAGPLNPKLSLTR
jgi:hypothetical protein